jgi:hypothetical protein
MSIAAALLESPPKGAGALFFSPQASCILFPPGDKRFAIHICEFVWSMQRRLSLSMRLFRGLLR